jgi:hypothetical protein
MAIKAFFFYSLFFLGVNWEFQILIEKSIPQYAHFPYLIQALPKRGWVKLI